MASPRCRTGLRSMCGSLHWPHNMERWTADSGEPAGQRLFGLLVKERLPSEMRRRMSQSEEVAEPDFFELMIARLTPKALVEEYRIKAVEELDERLAGVLS